MAKYRIKAQKTGPRTYEKELQMISYRGSSLFSDEGNTLISSKKVYYPPDYLSKGGVSVVMDSESYNKDGLSVANKFSRGRPAALPIEEQFREESEVSRTLLGIDRAEVQQGIFDDVSSYGLDRKDWVVYAGWTEDGQAEHWDRKNSPAGRYRAATDFDYAEGSSIVITTYPTPYVNPGNEPVNRRLRGLSGRPGVNWGKYLQSIIAMYIIEYMVNNFNPEQKAEFKLNFLERKYPKTSDGKFDRLYWDQIWLDIDQGRFEVSSNIPIIPQGKLVNMGFDEEEDNTINLAELLGLNEIDNPTLINLNVDYENIFFATTRYVWKEPDKGHYVIATNNNPDLWLEYWGINYDDDLPDEIKNWEFQVYASETEIPQFVIDYKLPYFLITSLIPSESLIFGESWPQRFSDISIPQISNAIADGNIIGARESRWAVINLTSIRAFRYQPGRISAFTYGVRISEEGAGPGATLEWGVENFTDGYFFRLQDGTDFSIVRRSTIPLGLTPLFIEAGYEEREGYISQLTGVVSYSDLITDSERISLEEKVQAGEITKIYETVIQQNQMNGDGLNSQGDSGYIFNPDTVTMYKIEFGWYGAIGARFYMYIPQSSGESRWVTVHTLVIENQLGQPCLEDPFFFFKYRNYVDSPSRIRLPQFVEKYGASYYIDGGDEGTVSISTGKATNRKIFSIDSDSITVPIRRWSTVLGLKPKQFIINNDGNVFQSKKEIFPVSASITSTQPIEIKLINQYACQENAYTFQEGYVCSLPEKQRLRGIFTIKPIEQNADALAALGRDENNPVPTLTYVEDDTSYPESIGNLKPDGTFSWTAYNNALLGAHIIGDKTYGAYVNPTQQYSSSAGGISSLTTILSRSTRDNVFTGPSRNRPWVDAELLFRYKDNIPLKLSPYRKDTTLLSTIEINSDEFYLLFTNRTRGGDDDYTAKCDGSAIFGCDGSHVGDFQIGIVWPTATPSTNFPLSQISPSRSSNKFGIIDPNDTNDRSLNNNEVEVLEDSDLGVYYVKDKKIPDSDNYRYYEGLPIDFESPQLNGNILVTNQVGEVIYDPSGFEVYEGVRYNFLGEVDDQFPNVPGLDAGQCHAIYGRVGEVSRLATWTTTNSLGEPTTGIYYLSSSTSWPSDLWNGSNQLSVESDDGTVVNVATIDGGEQEQYTPPGSSVRRFLLPVTMVPGNSPLLDGVSVIAKYRGIALYQPNLLRPDAAILAQRVAVGINIFPLRFFIRMREGAKIGAVSVGQVTANGIIQSPFTPHGSVLSVNNIDGEPDLHNGGSNDEEKAATKSLIAFSEPNTITSNEYSYFDVQLGTNNGVDRRKKCPSFISNNILSGAGFSGVGDYPLRWLKFKESGEPLASFFISENKPTELNLSSIFGINTESIGPSFWGNKSLFMIARNLSSGAEGKMSVTLNYKEQ
jgi:hypothetical protein